MAAALPRGFRLLQSCRGLTIRSRPLCSRPQALQQLARPYRLQSTDTNGQPPKAAEANAATEGSSNVEDSTANPVDRIDDAALEQMLYGGRVPQKGGLTGAQEQVLYRDGVIPVAEAAEETLAVGDAAAEASAEQAAEGEGLQGLGHKWPLPSRPYPDGFNHKKRYHPVIEQVSRLMMRDGKLATAQRNLAMAMNILRMSPEPTYNPQVPLMPGVPPASHLPLNPTMYLTVAMDSVAPLIKIVAIAGAGGGGRSLDMPRPLTVRQRRRRAFMWILEAAEKRQSKGSGRTQFPQRLAEEIIAVVEGRSGAWDKRKLIHKQGTAARANVTKRLHIKKGPSK